MKKSAPSSLGIIAIAALFGLIALIVAYALLHFAGMASFVIGLIVAIITAIVLWMGWGEPNVDTSDSDSMSAPSSNAATAVPKSAPASASAANTATSSGAAASTPAAVAASPKTAEPSEKAKAPAAKAAKPAAKTKAPAAKAAKPAAKAAKPAAKTAVKAKPAAKAADKPAAKAAAPKRAPVAADGKPDTLTKARAGGADDLKLLKGVGPGLEKTLNELGFYHFDQVAGWRKKEIEWVDSRLKFKGRIERDEWIKQAKVLAKGGETEFSKRSKK